MTRGGMIFGGVFPTFAFGFTARRELLLSTSGRLSHKSPAVLQKGQRKTTHYGVVSFGGLPFHLQNAVNNT